MAEQSFSECYEILQISPSELDWTTCRSSYKKLIQRWHPDKFQEGSADKLEAEDKIRHINAAYDRLSRYYQAHGELPGIRPALKKAPENNVVYSSDNSQENIDPYFTAQPSHKQRYIKRKTLALMSVMMLIVLLIISYEPDNVNMEGAVLPSIPEPRANTRAAQENHQQPAAVVVKKHAPTGRFTYGSTMSDVIIVQGPPDRVVNQTWYYGESTVLFKDGKVINWKRTPNSPINARVDAERMRLKRY